MIISRDRRDACAINQKGMGNDASKGLRTVLYTFIGHGHKMKHCNHAISIPNHIHIPHNTIQNSVIDSYRCLADLRGSCDH